MPLSRQRRSESGTRDGAGCHHRRDHSAPNIDELASDEPAPGGLRLVATAAKDQMTPGRIAVVITCHNLGRTLVEALASVERQTRPASEIVVVDDASTDIYTQQVLARLERDGTRVVQAGGRGVSAARNLGAQLTSAEYLVWLDADDVLEPGYFEAAGARLDADADLRFRLVRDARVRRCELRVEPLAPRHSSTQCRREAFPMRRRCCAGGYGKQIGGFDEDLLSFELLDFWASVMEQRRPGGCSR